jgi:hypothetical protein
MELTVKPGMYNVLITDDEGRILSTKKLVRQ